jgi:D-sedoheptulose 7-phosphate isomerase
MKTKWMHDYSDYYISIPSTSTPTIQEGHLILGHLLCHYIEEKLQPKVKDDF